MELKEMQKKTKEYLKKTYFGEKKVPDLLWNSRRSMLERYQAIESMIDFNGWEVLDVGCGYCDFYDYLSKQFVILKRYRGIDLHPDIVKEAKRRHPDLEISCEDILSCQIPSNSFDYCVGCGIVTFKIEDWAKRTKKIMKEMFRIARLGVVIDFLKDRKGGPLKDPKSYYCKMSEAMKIAEKIAPYVNLKNDYRFNSFSIFLFNGWSCK